MISNEYQIIDTFSNEYQEWIKDAHFLSVWDSLGGEKAFLNKETVKKNIEKQIQDIYNSDNHKVFILKNTEELLGFILLQIVENHFTSETICFILEIFVDPKFRGKGIGNRLMELAEKFAEEKKIKKVVLNVANNNKIASSLYKKMGYVEEKIRMSKKLD